MIYITLQYYQELLIEECIQDYEDSLLDSDDEVSDCISMQLTSEHVINDIYVSDPL